MLLSLMVVEVVVEVLLFDDTSTRYVGAAAVAGDGRKKNAGRAGDVGLVGCFGLVLTVWGVLCVAKEKNQTEQGLVTHIIIIISASYVNTYIGTLETRAHNQKCTRVDTLAQNAGSYLVESSLLHCHCGRIHWRTTTTPTTHGGENKLHTCIRICIAVGAYAL